MPATASVPALPDVKGPYFCGIYHALAADKAGLEGAWRGYHYFQMGGKGHRLATLGDLPITFSDVAMAYVNGCRE